jgi:hypothetical protein
MVDQVVSVNVRVGGSGSVMTVVGDTVKYVVVTVDRNGCPAE